MPRISNRFVQFYPETGRIVEPNPVPTRALKVRHSSPMLASDWSGIGRIDWREVEAFSAKDISDYKQQMEIGELLAVNAKTKKPRPSGRLGLIKGMSLAPHFYANLLAETGVKDSGALSYVDKERFNGFNGRTRAEAIAGSGVSKNDLLDFCRGASKFCRQTCLVTTGQHPTTKQAAHAKMKFTFAFLENPELFVAILYAQLRRFGRNARRENVDAVVRLNMLSDLPWYVICPELLEALEGDVAFYDYTKVEYWGVPEYERVRHLLDLTYSFSGSNDKQCEEALQVGERIAVVFAPIDPQRSTSRLTRTTWAEIVASGLVDKKGRARLFGGAWPLVDGDESDYRIDDPQPSIVALNFKQPNITPDTAPHLEAGLPESRKHFTVKVGEDTPEWKKKSALYAKARATQIMWRQLPRAEKDKLLRKYPEALRHDAHGHRQIDQHMLPVDVVIEYYKRYRAEMSKREKRGRRKNPLPLIDPPAKQDDPSEVLDASTHIPMAVVEGTSLLIGPHVPTILND